MLRTIAYRSCLAASLLPHVVAEADATSSPLRVTYRFTDIDGGPTPLAGRSSVVLVERTPGETNPSPAWIDHWDALRRADRSGS